MISYRKIKDKMHVFLCVLFILHSSHANESTCDFKDIEESIQDIGKDMDHKFNEADIAEIDGKIGGVIDRFTNLPEDCQHSCETVQESIKDIKIIRQYAKEASSEQYSDDKCIFTGLLNVAEGITPLDKQAELYRALARISPLNEAENNQKFYKIVKNKMASSDSTITNILLDTQKTIVEKSIKLIDSLSVHSDLFFEVVVHDKVGENKVNNANEDMPLEVRVVLASGQICAADNATGSEDIYVKYDEIDTIIYRKFVETSDGDFIKEPINKEDGYFTLQAYLPLQENVPNLFSENSTVGKWEIAPDGTDCKLKEEIHNIYLCYQARTFINRTSDNKVKEDLLKLNDSILKRKESCSV